MNAPDDADPQGHPTEDAREWLERVADAAQSAADALRETGDPHSRALLEDLNDLHEQIAVRLRALDQ